MSVPQKKADPGDVMEGLIIQGDLSGLSSDQRVVYYNRVCDSIGVNPLTQPFQYLKLQGKLILYATRACADQLRKLHGIDIEIISQEISDGLLTVHTRAKDKSGRVDEDLGVVSFPDTLRGELRANQILKCVTKAKRRVTLSISGLGFLDETETDIPGAEKKPLEAAPNVMVKPVQLPDGKSYDRETGEITESVEEKAPLQGVPSSTLAGAAPSVTTGGAALSIQDMAREAASRGKKVFNEFWRNRTAQEQDQIGPIREELRRVLEAPAQKDEADDGQAI